MIMMITDELYISAHFKYKFTITTQMCKHSYSFFYHKATHDFFKNFFFQKLSLVYNNKIILIQYCKISFFSSATSLSIAQNIGLLTS